jgi:putative transcriptional regulator
MADAEGVEHEQGTHTGKLLVASPALTDPNFDRTVVYLCSHTAEGALGVVLNRPIEEFSAAEHLPTWAPYLATPPVLFRGGPVEPSTALALARALDVPEGPGWTLVTGTTGLFDLRQEPAEAGPRLAALRIFAGYSGWAAGQLEGEIEAEGWFVVEPWRSDLFTATPETLWRDVLRRQPGELAIYADFPRDRNVN